MAYELMNCPYTGGQTKCNPACVNFYDTHGRLEGGEVLAYCRKWGIMEIKERQTKMNAEELRR